MTIINTTHTIYTIEKATEMAAQLMADADGETYRVVPNPNGADTAIIAIYEDEEFITYL